jgi:predicted nucleic acid-binding protein
MMVVADASPLRYLVVIGVMEVLKTLYSRLLVPEAVVAEQCFVRQKNRGRHQGIRQAGDIRDSLANTLLGSLDRG